MYYYYSVEERIVTSFYLWATILVPERDERVISEFVKLGYNVESLVEGNTTTTAKGCPAAVLALKISKPDGKTKLEPGAIRSAFSKIANDNKISYYSLIVSQGNIGCAWAAGNIDLSEIDKKTAAIIKIGAVTSK